MSPFDGRRTNDFLFSPHGTLAFGLFDERVAGCCTTLRQLRRVRQYGVFHRLVAVGLLQRSSSRSSAGDRLSCSDDRQPGTLTRPAVSRPRPCYADSATEDLGKIQPNKILYSSVIMFLFSLVILKTKVSDGRDDVPYKLQSHLHANKINRSKNK